MKRGWWIEGLEKTKSLRTNNQSKARNNVELWDYVTGCWPNFSKGSMSGQRARFSDGATIRSPSSLVESTKLNDERRKLRFPNRFSKTSTFVGTRRKQKGERERGELVETSFGTQVYKIVLLPRSFHSPDFESLRYTFLVFVVVPKGLDEFPFVSKRISLKRLQNIL